MLLEHHLAELQRSGLTDETIRAAGVYSEVDTGKLSALLDWTRYPSKCAPAIVFPFTATDGRNGYCRIRPDHPRISGGKLVKYESPKGQPNQIYIPPGVADALGDPQRELLLTEGEKKSLCASQYGFPCIGLVGVLGWKEKGRQSLLPTLQRIPWKDRLVYIVFDSDISTKEDVQSAEAQLAAHLKNLGAKVRVCRIPEGPAGADGKPTKQGIDDYVVAQVAAGVDPKKAIRDLLNAAEEPTPPSAIEIKESASKADPGHEADCFLTKTEQDGLPRLRFWRGGYYYWSRGAYAEIPPAEARGEVVKYLDKRFIGLSSNITSNVLDVVKAKAMLPGRIEPPAWIGEKAAAWSADEVLAGKKWLVHIPSVVAGEPHIIPATPRFFTTNAIDYDFRADASEPKQWLTFLSELWPDDPASVATLQEWMGYTLTPDTRQQKILLVIGPRRSGKGTIARTQRSLIGAANCCAPTLASLAQNFGLWPLLGKSVAIISDARLGGRTDSQIVVERLLSISGEDPITADRKFQEPVTAKLSTRLMIFSNELPRLGDSSGALAGRMIVLRLMRSFYGKEDHDLGAKLEAELPGILLWAVAGWQRLRGRGRFEQPDSGREMIDGMADLSSPVGAFVRDCCLVGPGYRAGVDDLFAEWKLWCERNGRREAGTIQTFGRDLVAAVATLKRVRTREGDERGRAYEGIGVKTGF
jgi:putative DNA primase/helicase